MAGRAGGTTTRTGETGKRSATVNLPFVTAQFRVPDLQPPSREELGWVLQTAQSMLPSGRTLLFFGGLTATAIAGIIEWPVAAAIGIGSALARQGATNPEPRNGIPHAMQARTADTNDAGVTSA